ncbi:MAG: homoserine O-succinyltransferase [Myxococcales bacterium]|jgi:homoserine O-succinyltransferase|nr:homoserine O-succinyltransferase [Myxococcales bacterium]
MPIIIPNDLPAMKTLDSEGIFVIPQSEAVRQDIRALQVVLLNLMPTKIETETQIARLLANSPLQVELTLLQTATHKAANTSEEHLLQFYKTFDQVKDRKFDGLIVTGAPVETLEFSEVDYWPELVSIFEWSRTNVHASLFICWGAQAALYHFHGVPKYRLVAKHSGVYKHRLLKPYAPVVRGIDDEFYVPVSRYTEVRKEDIEKIGVLEILSESPGAGLYLVHDRVRRRLYSFNHAEYDPDTLKREYERDLARGLNPAIPCNYYPDDDPTQPPIVRWRSHAWLLFANWLNYEVYQGFSRGV